MDENYLKQELTKLHLWEFYGNLRRTVMAWFEDGAHDEITEWITRVIFAGGSWGVRKNREMADVLRRTPEGKKVGAGKARWLLGRLFPSMQQMQYRYPVLKKLPVLLPLFWPVRWIQALLFGKKHLTEGYQSITKNSSEEIEAYARSLEFVGLGFERTK